MCDSNDLFGRFGYDPRNSDIKDKTITEDMSDEEYETVMQARFDKSQDNPPNSTKRDKWD